MLLLFAAYIWKGKSMKRDLFAILLVAVLILAAVGIIFAIRSVNRAKNELDYTSSAADYHNDAVIEPSFPESIDCDRNADYTTYYGTFTPLPKVLDVNEYMILNHTALTAEESLCYITPNLDVQTAAELLERIAELSEEICDGCVTDSEKAYAIAMWVGTNIAYDMDAAQTGVDLSVTSLEAVFENGMKTTCAGFTNMFSALCSAQGLYCLNMKGGSSSQGYLRSELDVSPSNHEWCAVLIDGEWVFVDPTWISDLTVTGGETIGGEDIKPFYAAFDFGQMSVEHRIDRCEHRIYSAETEGQTDESDFAQLN